jgi:DNA-binding NarL/FixJ family response regulator
VLSNQNENEDVGHAKEVGAIGYIIKAETVPSEVVKKVTKLISKE